ncbi:hypothetical protein V1294_003759 [Bradyrhizobium sp. AZCC 1678]
MRQFQAGGGQGKSGKVTLDPLCGTLPKYGRIASGAIVPPI